MWRRRRESSILSATRRFSRRSPGLVDDPHAAPAQLGEDLIAVRGQPVGRNRGEIRAAITTPASRRDLSPENTHGRRIALERVQEVGVDLGIDLVPGTARRRRRTRGPESASVSCSSDSWQSGQSSTWSPIEFSCTSPS